VPAAPFDTRSRRVPSGYRVLCLWQFYPAIIAVCITLTLLSTLAGCGQVAGSFEREDPALLTQRIEQRLFEAQRALARDPTAARAEIDAAVAQHAALVPRLPVSAANAASVASDALAAAQSAATGGDELGLIQARADYQTALLWAGYLATLDATRSGQGQAAATWLKLRAYRESTRLSPASSSATVAIEDLIAGRTTPEHAATIVQAELDGTYQALMVDAVEASATATFQGYRARAADSAARAAGYYRILRASFANPPAADRAFADLRAAVVAADWPAIQRARAAIAAALAQ
jgi:high-affinity iron transporter